MKEQTIEKIIAFFGENDEIFSACMEELDSYNDIREAKPLTIKRRGDDGKRLIRCVFQRNCCKS